MIKSPEQIEREKLYLRLRGKMREASMQYGLLEDGDHILIGLSGGKDSLALVELLGQQAQIYVPKIEVVAVHVSVEKIGYHADLDYLKHFCEQYKVRFIHRSTDYEDLPEGHENKNHCFLCSWYRRKALFEAAKELGCNKIALGHHRDDILQTLLMNMIYEGTISTMPPKLPLDKMPITLIRPLCLIDESEIARYAQLSDYGQQVKQCPFEHESSRTRVKDILGELEQLNPQVRDSLWAAMGNIKQQYL